MPFSPKSSQETTMRKTFEPQITFGTVPMSNIKFDIFCRHELVPILMALQQLYFNKPVLNEILVLIKEDIVEDKDEKLRGDSFVVQKNIHYPTDANLILDGIELQ
jgi:hypothetical protein